MAGQTVTAVFLVVVECCGRLERSDSCDRKHRTAFRMPSMHRADESNRSSCMFDLVDLVAAVVVAVEAARRAVVTVGTSDTVLGCVRSLHAVGFVVSVSQSVADNHEVDCSSESVALIVGVLNIEGVLPADETC
jgi:hypothetical protein